MPEGISVAPSNNKTNTSHSVQEPLSTINKPSAFNGLIPTEIFEFLDINDVRDQTSTNIRNKVHNIIDFISKSINSEDIGDILQEISNIELRLNRHAINTKRYDVLLNYITIQRQISSLKKIESAMMNGKRINR